VAKYVRRSVSYLA
jgi:hypothetical protein